MTKIIFATCVMLICATSVFPQNIYCEKSKNALSATAFYSPTGNWANLFIGNVGLSFRGRLDFQASVHVRGSKVFGSLSTSYLLIKGHPDSVSLSFGPYVCYTNMFSQGNYIIGLGGLTSINIKASEVVSIKPSIIITYDVRGIKDGPSYMYYIHSEHIGLQIDIPFQIRLSEKTKLVVAGSLKRQLQTNFYGGTLGFVIGL